MDSSETASRFSRIIVDRNLSQMRLARSLPLDRLRICNIRRLLMMAPGIHIPPRIPAYGAAMLWAARPIIVMQPGS